jgi:hypothetical protein
MTTANKKTEVKVGEKGPLLWEESAIEMDKRKNRYILTGFVWIAIWIIVGLWLGNENTTFLLFAFSLIFFGFVMVYWGFGQLPNRIYENGLEYGMEFPPFLTETRTFVSWGECLRLREIKGNYIFICSASKVVNIRHDIYDTFDFLKDIRDRIGKEEYRILVDIQEKTENSRKFELYLYPIVLLGVTFMSFIIAIALYGWTLTPNNLIINLSMVIPLLSILLLGIFLYCIPLRRLRFGIKLKINMKRLIAMFVVLNMIFLVMVGLGWWAPRRYYQIVSLDFRMHDRPRDYWDGSLDFINGTYNLDQSIYVQRGSQMRVINATLYLMGGGIAGIYVDRGASCLIENSTLASQNSRAGFWFEVYGELHVYGSRIMYLWGDPYYENFDGGIELYDADATFETSFIESCQTNGILAESSRLSVRSCIVQDCGDDGIELHNSPAIIENTTFKYNSWPLMFWYESDAKVTNCTFDYNQEGCWIAESSPVIKNCVFKNTGTGPAIVISGYMSYPIFEDNTFENNEVDIEDRGVIPYQVCMIFLPIFSLIIIIGIRGRNKKI